MVITIKEDDIVVTIDSKKLTWGDHVEEFLHGLQSFGFSYGEYPSKLVEAMEDAHYDALERQNKANELFEAECEKIRNEVLEGTDAKQERDADGQGARMSSGTYTDNQSTS